MNILRRFLDTFGRIRGIPCRAVDATVPPPVRTRYVRACDLPPDIDVAAVSPWRVDANEAVWYRIEGGPADA